MQSIARANTDEKWTDDTHSPDGPTDCNEASDGLKARNPIGFGEDSYPLEMCATQATCERGFSRIPVKPDLDMTLISDADGGFLGRPQGWER